MTHELNWPQPSSPRTGTPTVQQTRTVIYVNVTFPNVLHAVAADVAALIAQEHTVSDIRLQHHSHYDPDLTITATINSHYEVDHE